MSKNKLEEYEHNKDKTTACDEGNEQEKEETLDIARTRMLDKQEEILHCVEDGYELDKIAERKASDSKQSFIFPIYQCPKWMICNKIVEETGFSHRYVDIVLVKFGHRKDDIDTGIIEGICLEDNPKCKKCLLAYRCKKIEEAYHVEQIEVKRKVYKNKENKLFDKATKGLVEIHSIEELNTITDQVKVLLICLLTKLDQADIGYRIKKRGDGIALTQKDDLSKNICTIWMSKMKINILVLGAEGELGERNKKGVPIYSIEKIDDYLIRSIKKKSENRL